MKGKTKKTGKKIQTKSARETERVARDFAVALLSEPLRDGACVVALEGDLGGGKTTFAKGFARGLGVREKVASPTFVLMNVYQISRKRAVYKHFIHIDAYRMDSPKELERLGWREMVRDPKNIILIEWASRVRRLLPKDAIHVQFTFVDDTTRSIIFM